MGIRIVLYEDNADLREGLSVLLKGTFGIEFMGAFVNCDHVVEEMKSLAPEIILMDIDMPGTNGIEGLKLIKAFYPKIEILMLTVFDDNAHIFEAICNGASGYILKTSSPALIIESIQQLHNGGAPMSPDIARKVLNLFPKTIAASPDYALSPREKETLSFLVKGHSYKMIAEQMGVTVFTINAHCKKIYEKLHVHSNTEAIVKAVGEKII